MKVVLKTDEYTIFQRRDERYAVKDAGKAWVNGDAKITILLEHKLIEAAAPKAPAAEAEEQAPAAEPEQAPAAEPEQAPAAEAEQEPAAEPEQEPAEAEEAPAAEAEAPAEEPAAPDSGDDAEKKES